MITAFLDAEGIRLSEHEDGGIAVWVVFEFVLYFSKRCIFWVEEHEEALGRDWEEQQLWVDHGCGGVAEGDQILGEDGAVGAVVEDVLGAGVGHADEDEGGVWGGEEIVDLVKRIAKQL